MIVFKNYFNIVKGHLGIIIMFSAISIGISVVNTSYKSTEDYASVEPKIAVINYDDSALSDNFVEYITERAEIVKVEDDEKTIQDTLYLNKADSILIIPDNFGANLLTGNEPNIKIKKSTQNISEYTELLVNRYFKIAESYSKVGMSESEIIENIEKTIESEIEVKVFSENKSDMAKLAVYYSFENYAFLSIFTFIIGTIMCIFNKETIRKRNNVSKLNPKSFSNQLFLGHATLTLSIWAIFILISIILYKDLMLTVNGLLLIFNSLCFAITATSLAYLIGCLIKNENVISGIQNVISLGLSFISGCFVSVEWLDTNIVNFSKMFPSYWFIQGNYDITKLSTFNYETIKPIIQNYGIVLAFGIVYFAISKVIIAKGLKNNKKIFNIRKGNA